MKKYLVVLSCVLAGLLAGCGSATPAAESSSAAASVAPQATQSVAPAGPTSTPTSAASPSARTVRGNLAKHVGESAGLTNAKGEQLVRFTVKAITVADSCPSYQPKNGMMIVLDFDVETTAALAQEQYKMFNLGQGWKAIAENGTRMNGEALAYGCSSQAETLPYSFGPAEKATGKLAFDVPAPAGTLIFEPAGTGNGGWEWTYPAK